MVVYQQTEFPGEVSTELRQLAEDLGLTDLEERAIYHYKQWRGKTIIII